jgi:hypothetical protein
MGNALGVTAPIAPLEKCAVAVGDQIIRGEKQLKHMTVVKLVGIALVKSIQLLFTEIYDCYEKQRDALTLGFGCSWLRPDICETNFQTGKGVPLPFLYSIILLPDQSCQTNHILSFFLSPYLHRFNLRPFYFMRLTV